MARARRSPSTNLRSGSISRLTPTGLAPAESASTRSFSLARCSVSASGARRFSAACRPCGARESWSAKAWAGSARFAARGCFVRVKFGNHRDVSAHHAHLSEVDLGYFDSHCHVVPPLRSLRDRDALRSALADGTVDALCSDHAPVDEDAKQIPFAESEPGATGLELLLPLALKWAKETQVALPDALARVTSAPAAILGVPAGEVAVGGEADLCVFDADAHVRITADSLKSQGKNTPFIGYELPGRVRYTLVGGQIVYEA